MASDKAVARQCMLQYTNLTTQGSDKLGGLPAPIRAEDDGDLEAVGSPLITHNPSASQELFNTGSEVNTGGYLPYWL